MLEGPPARRSFPSYGGLEGKSNQEDRSMTVSQGTWKNSQCFHAGAAERLLARVIPSVDINSGLIVLIFHGEVQHRWCSNPQLLVSTLARSVGPVLWDKDSADLRISVAAAGCRRGKVVEIPLFVNRQVSAP
jgi:hypothetical protein